MRSRLLLPFCGLGCATLPVTGANATGERLSVFEGFATTSGVRREKVGEVEDTNAVGTPVGKADVYQDRAVTTSRPIWFPRQGRARLEDEDFFRRAGDAEAATDVHAARERGVLLNRVGWVGTAVCFAAIIAGGSLSKDPNASQPLALGSSSAARWRRSRPARWSTSAW